MHLPRPFLLSLCCLGSAALAQAQDSLLGFTSEHAAAERKLEQQFDRGLDKNNPRAWLKRLSSRPHHVGSAWGLNNALFMRDLFRSWGYSADIEEFQVLFPVPKERVLELRGPHPFRAKLSEPEVPGDSTSKPSAEQLPPYNCYSIDGNITAKLIYVNYGMPKDYETLESKGLDVKGKIVIARYGAGWRGLKPKLAAEHGAVGCLIYSDPRDDGYYQGDVYPQGPFRNENGVQRGSVQDMPVQSGDPLTPGYGAVAGAPRLSLKDVKVLTKIPVTAISYGDAAPLLADLGGSTAPESWRGALPITYHIGPSKNDCHLKLAFDWTMATARDVIAKLPGSQHPDEWVIRGNHHDGWVTGAQDPLSGTVALLEEARGVAELHRGGWAPSRTLIYCCWDGEEPGLLGSTEWVETHAEELRAKGAVYINSDENGRGFLGMEGSHSLEAFINEVARDVPDPEAGISVAERSKAHMMVGASPEARSKLRSTKDIEIGALGSGSDFSPFLQHVGIASLNLGYGGENPGGIYHSAYDSFDWYTRFDDTTFDYELALAKTAGRAMLRLANADALPLQFGHLSHRISQYVQELVKLTDSTRDETAEQNRMIADGSLKASLDPQKPDRVPLPKEPVPFIDFSPLMNAGTHLAAASDRYDKVLSGADLHRAYPNLDLSLIATERAMLTPEGLPGRPWYKHMVYAPGLYTGYGVKTLPSVREAIEQRDWAQATVQARVVAATIEKLAAQIDIARAALSVR
jgi:N-acetylated-alpha-linked acidic dipeptidase